MKQATVSNLKNQLSHYLRFVKRGEAVRVLDRGVPVAEILPLSRKTAAPNDRLHVLEGKGVIRRGDPVRLRRFVPVGIGNTGVLESLLEERRSGR